MAVDSEPTTPVVSSAVRSRRAARMLCQPRTGGGRRAAPQGRLRGCSALERPAAAGHECCATSSSVRTEFHDNMRTFVSCESCAPPDRVDIRAQLRPRI